MSPLYIVLALVPVAVAFRYALEETQAARFVGMALASPEYLRINRNGFRDAVSIPQARKWFFLLFGLFVGGLALLVVGYGWLWALAGLFGAFLSSALAQVWFLPRRDSRHFLMRFFASMSRRFADFERDGDKQRAIAIKHLLDLFAVRFGEVLAKEPRS
jgi:hypothetical protein